MFGRNHGYALAMLASFSFLSFTACSDDVVNNPMPMATESSAAESSSSETFSNPISSSDVASSSSVQEIERPSLEKMNEKCREQHDAVSIAAFDGVKTEYFCLLEAYGPKIEETFSILDHAEISLYTYAENGWQEVKCNAENEGRKELYAFFNTHWPGNLYYKCTNNQWVQIGYEEYHSLSELACSAEEEGKVDSAWVGANNPRFHYVGQTKYYRCEKGLWTLRDRRITCDTTGVAVGDVCTKEECFVGVGCSQYSYTYVGNGAWREASLSLTDKAQIIANCQKEDTVVGDTCSVEMSDGTKCYRFNEQNDWEECESF
ncbi:hypothetical protein [Fibrobacter sp. UWB11]|uniref:hypothetical protein n=1 Tax=Fibrobacter sp. UWB11 TaxID=1896202 RepID=UPI000928A567|nr:hypothetical protein [Fibrobacter sp. UWB11]SIO30681.1 hypothetical protein SAMN05720758_2147 [Fibrobacter sp. UWB11]